MRPPLAHSCICDLLAAAEFERLMEFWAIEFVSSPAGLRLSRRASQALAGGSEVRHCGLRSPQGRDAQRHVFDFETTSFTTRADLVARILNFGFDFGSMRQDARQL